MPMLVLMWRRWPSPGAEMASRLARGTLLAGLSASSVGLLVEAAGAFGYTADGVDRANSLAELHDIGVALWPLGFVLMLAGAIMTGGVWLAARRGAAGSWIATAAAVLAVTAAVLFIAGALVFGY